MIPLRRQKLVSVCSVENSIISEALNYIVNENSSSKTKVQTSIRAPINTYNILLLEIYPESRRRGTDALPCQKLNFISLCCEENTKAEDIRYNFEQDYQYVEYVDLTGHIGSMRLAFDLLKNFKNLKELVFLVNDYNVHFPFGRADNFKGLRQYPNVTSVKIIHDSANVGESTLDIQSATWRLDEFLSACNECFPNLEKLKVSIHGTGANLDKIKNFIAGHENLKNYYLVEVVHEKVRTKIKQVRAKTPPPPSPADHFQATISAFIARNIIEAPTPGQSSTHSTIDNTEIKTEQGTFGDAAATSSMPPYNLLSNEGENILLPNANNSAAEQINGIVGNGGVGGDPRLHGIADPRLHNNLDPRLLNSADPRLHNMNGGGDPRLHGNNNGDDASNNSRQNEQMMMGNDDDDEQSWTNENWREVKTEYRPSRSRTPGPGGDRSRARSRHSCPPYDRTPREEQGSRKEDDGGGGGRYSDRDRERHYEQRSRRVSRSRSPRGSSSSIQGRGHSSTRDRNYGDNEHDSRDPRGYKRNYIARKYNNFKRRPYVPPPFRRNNNGGGIGNGRSSRPRGNGRGFNSNRNFIGRNIFDRRDHDDRDRDNQNGF